MSVLCTTIRLLLWQLPLKTLSLTGVHSLSLFLTLPTCCCFCSCSLLLRCSSLQCCTSFAVAQSISILVRWVSAVLSLSLSLPIHRSLTVNYKWPSKRIKIKQWQHVPAPFSLTPATFMALIYTFFQPHVVVSCCFSPSLFFFHFQPLLVLWQYQYSGIGIVLHNNTMVLLAVSLNFVQYVPVIDFN